MTRTGFAATLLFLGGLAITSQVARATWPVARQNPQHTALAPGEGLLDQPAVRGRTYLGGSLGTTSMLASDINDDGLKEMALVVGGKVILKDPRDRVLWDTANLGATSLLGLYDFDGGGGSDLLVLGSDGLIILRGRDGAILWHKSQFKENNNTTSIENTRVVDLTGDGLPDIVTKAFWFSDAMVHAYSFSTGYNLANPDANQLWAHQIKGGTLGGYFPAVGDITGDGVPEVVSSMWQELDVFNGRTGGSPLIIPTTHILYFGQTRLDNLDDDPQQEVLHLTTSGGVAKAIEVFDVVKNRTGVMAEVVFSTSDVITHPTENVADLDGDGRPEFGISRWTGTQWLTSLYRYEEKGPDPTKGSLTEVARADHQVLVGLLDVDGDGVKEVLTRAALPGRQSLEAFSTLRALRLSGSSLGTVWSLSGGAWQVLGSRGSSSLNPVGSAGVPAAQDVDGDGTLEFYVSFDRNGDLLGDELALYDASSGVPVEQAHLALPPDLRMGVVEVGANLSGPEAPGQALTFDSDGVLWVYTPLWNSAARLSVGGFYKRAPFSPQVADVNQDGRPELLVSNAAGVLKVLDAVGLVQTGLEDPVTFSYDGLTTQYPLAVDADGDGALELVVRNFRDPTRLSLDSVGVAGEVTRSLGLSTSAFNLLSGDFTGSAAEDIFGTRRGTDGKYYNFVIDGESWGLAWEEKAPYDLPVDDRANAVLDVDGDGQDDILFGQNQYLCAAKGSDGSSLGCASVNLYAGGILVDQVEVDSALDICLLTPTGVALLDSGLTSDWFKTHADGQADWSSGAMNRDGVLADANGDGLSEIFFAVKGTLYRFEGNGSTGWQVSLGGGVAGGASSGAELGAVAGGDVDGDGELELVVGGSDGWLYAVNGESGALEWSVPLLYALGEPVLGDLDGDGLLDVGVSAADGYFYILTPAGLAAPAEVRDVAMKADGTAGDASVDVDQTEVVDRMAASWDGVFGAAGYLYAVVSEQNTYVVNWTDVGKSTSVIISDSRLLYGHAYRVVVQAYADDGSGSPWAFSDGVTIIDSSPPKVSSVRAVPSPFDPDLEGTVLQASLEDLTGLTGFSVSVLDGTQALFRYSAAAGSTLVNPAIPWDGLDTNGLRAADGVYTLRFTATDVAGRTTAADGTVEVYTFVPTPEPTASPTPEPTEVPTEEPTEEPTEVPTDFPTDAPTVGPTEEPTLGPTDFPTDEPTVGPTEDPTQVPTEEPTEVPTEEPTVSPTDEPTLEPTEEPTMEPTEEPTVAPTEEPTVSPTAFPTEVPTTAPGDDDTSPVETTAPGDDDTSPVETTAPGDDDATGDDDTFEGEVTSTPPDPGDDDFTGGYNDEPSGCGCSSTEVGTERSASLGMLLLGIGSVLYRRRKGSV